MKVRDIMTTEVATAAPDTTLEEIATMMRDENVGSIPIVDDDELTGIVTDRDIVVRCIADGKDATETTAEEVASDDIETVEPDDDVEDAADIMGRRQIRRLPVVEDGRLVGIVALGDIAVKERDDEASAEALEEISEGVKGRGRKGAQGAARGRGQQARGREEERGSFFEEEEEEEISVRGRSGRREGSPTLMGRSAAPKRGGQSESRNVAAAGGRGGTRLMGNAEETASRGQVRSSQGAGPSRTPKADRKRDERVARGEAGSARGLRAGSAPSGREGQLGGTRGTGRSGQPGGRGEQGISNRSAAHEASRQQRVSPQRATAERGGSKRRRRA